MPSEDRDPSIFVHERGDRSLDGIFRLIELAGQQRSLDEVLAAVCADVAATVGADVVSIYVREEVPGPQGGDGPGEPVFTMRGNVGFPAEAVGRVRLRRGEGIIGFVADRLRPVSVATAASDEHFKYIPGLGEERFPALLAVPVLRGGGASGVLVLQRQVARTFNGEEVVLATALAAVISHALERAEERERAETRRGARGVARLGGAALSGGAAWGRAEILPTLAALTRAAAPPPGAGPAGTMSGVVARLRADLVRAGQKLGGVGAREIATLTLILDDDRFCTRLAEASASAAPLKALSDLAREYARVPFQTERTNSAAEQLLTERAAEIEDLCVLVYAGLSGRPLIRGGAIVVAERLRSFMAVSAIARGASAFVIDGDVPADGLVAGIVSAAGLPLLGSVTGVFSWVSPDDLLVVDADADEPSVRINPEATAVARFRTRRSD
jgi:phosphotransferase system enzyme I (PtsP)